MKLLIDIPEHIYEHAKESSEDSRDEFDAMRAIANGTQQESGSGNPNTCGDAISRQAVLDAIDTYDKFGYTETGCFVREPKGDYVPYIHYDDVIKCIKNASPVTPQPKMGRWIPVSKRLPEESKKCLVTFKGGYVGIMCYASDLYGVDEYDFCDEKGMAGWFDYDRELGHYSRDDVIAWISLPEPYMAESEAES